MKRLINLTNFLGALLIISDSLFNFCVASELEYSELNVKCKQVCKTYSEVNLNRAICNRALNVQPRPGVYRACLNGLLIAFEHACIPTCMGESYPPNNAKHTTPGDSYNVCKSEWNRPRPNNQLPWCRRGYDVTFENVKKEIEKIAIDLREKADDILEEEESSTMMSQIVTEKRKENVNEKNEDLDGENESTNIPPQVVTNLEHNDEKESIEVNGNDEFNINTLEETIDENREVESSEIDEFITESETQEIQYEEEDGINFFDESDMKIIEEGSEAIQVDSKSEFVSTNLDKELPQSNQASLHYESNLRVVSSFARSKSLNSSIDSEIDQSREL